MLHRRSETRRGPEDAATSMRSRLRSDLLVAMRERRTGEVALIRELIAMIDNAEAPTVQTCPDLSDHVRHEFSSGSAEVERLVLSSAQVHALFLQEIERRERAATQFEGLGDMTRANAFRSEALMARRYVE